jgi:hypothetical protein
MRRAPIALCVLVAIWPLVLSAAPLRELSQAQLRAAVSSGQSVSVKEALKSVRRVVPGDPVDVRAYAGDGVFYRVLMLQATGVVKSVVIDAETGEVLSSNSPQARDVNATAKSQAKSTTSTAKNSTAASNGTSAGGGKSNGNSGGNGAGSGGGNAGGNGGGNGNGNGGGNAGGNGNSGGNGNAGGNGNGNAGGNGNGNAGGNGNGNGKN